MRKNTNIKFGSTNRKKKLNIKKLSIVIVTVVGILYVGGQAVDATASFISDKKEEKILIQKQEEEKKIAEEKKRKEEEEAKKNIVGVKYEAKKNSYDALEVAKKLNTYDYRNNGEKIVFLTFDDGSSTTVTPQVLDTLKANGINATFFVTGQNIERGGDKAKKLVKRTFEEGNAIANHSYSHDYSHLYPNRTLNLENFKADFKKTDDILKEIISPYFSTRVIRCPGGHMSWKGMEPLDSYLEENQMASIDWNALNADSEGKKKSANELFEYVKQTSEGKEMVVVLMHDTYGKEETAKALPQIIQYFKDNGYVFKTLV